MPYSNPNNPKRLEYMKQYRKKNKQKLLSYAKSWRKNCNEKCKLKRKIYIKKYNEEYRNKHKAKIAKQKYDYYRKLKKEEPHKILKSELEYRYGTGAYDFYKLCYDKQEGHCKICKKHESAFNHRLCLDHNHATGEWRGVICSKCNTILGLLKDCPEIAHSIGKYLDETNKENAPILPTL